MPRGPFLGTFSPGVRPTIVTAPDALVYINGTAEVIGCNKCKRSFPFNKYITSIQVDLSVDSVPGSASINLSIPRHAIDDFFVEGEPLVMEMMEVEIFAKGHFLVEGMPQYYPIFWGLITEVTDSASGGEKTVTIQCADILKWWEVCKMAVNSAFTSPQPGQRGMSMMGNVFFGENPYDMIWTLSQQAFGDVVVGTGSLINFLPEKSTQRETFKAAMSDIMLYWNRRFSRMRSNLLLYGVNGVAVRGDTLTATYNSGTQKKANLKNMASRAVALANGGPDSGQMVFDPTDPSVVAFKTIFQFNVPFWQSEYQSKLELATATKEAIGYEFYMDVDGSIVFKPPFFNLDVLGNKPVSWIQDIDIIDWSGVRSESEVVTQIQMSGSMQGNIDYGFGEETTPVTTVTDYHLLRQFGWRAQTYNSEFLGDPVQMFYHGMDMLDRYNSRRHRANVTIPLRPELRLGFPVYIANKDQMWYVTGISHNIQFGGRAQTTLTLTAQRKKWVAPQGIGTMKKTGYTGTTPTSGKPSSRQLQKGAKFEVNIQEAVTWPPTTEISDGPSPYDPMILRHPRTGRIVGYPNAVMVYTRPVATPDNVVKRNLGQRTTPSPQISKENQAKLQERGQKIVDAQDQTVNMGDDIRLRERYITNRYSYGLNSAGAFVYARDADNIIQELLLLPSKNIDVKSMTSTVDAPQNSSAMIRPVSDSRGFEVIGHFRYGRGVSLRDGRLILNAATGVNDVAKISTQVALTGDLYATLSAQSQGITPSTTGAPSLAESLSTLSADDVQTSGIKNPETGKTEWSDTGTAFVGSAPLGSPQQKGVEPSVEASQLSRALSLSELSITDTMPDADCECLLGRANLAFINFQYSGKVITGTSTDGGSLTEGLSPIEVTPSEQKSFLGKVDQFLFDLYAKLGGEHRQYETELRGGESTETADDLRSGNFSTNFGDLTPPFSAPNRFAVGDPRAIALQADSAKDDLASTWNDFGSNLKKSANRSELQQELANAQSDLEKARAQKERLEKARGTTSEDAVAKALGGKDSQTTLNDLNNRITQLENDITATRGKLAQNG